MKDDLEDELVDVTKKRLIYEGDDYTVTLDCSDGSIPNGAVLTVTESEHEEDRKALMEELDATNLPYARFFDMVVIDKEGEVVEISDAVVSIELTDMLSGENMEQQAQQR